MTYSAPAIANYFIEKAVIAGSPATHLKLQKLVYISHGWNLALRGAPLIGEVVEAWRYGPVSRELYRNLRAYGSAPIVQPIRVWRGSEIDTPAIDAADTDTLGLLDRVWSVYGKLTALQLSSLTHQPETPWAKARARSPQNELAMMSNEEIREHYLHLARSKATVAPHGVARG